MKSNEVPNIPISQVLDSKLANEKEKVKKGSIRTTKVNRFTVSSAETVTESKLKKIGISRV